jgi:hypothetical protein
LMRPQSVPLAPAEERAGTMRSNCGGFVIVGTVRWRIHQFD